MYASTVTWCAEPPVPSLQQEEPKGLCSEICADLLPGIAGDGIAQASMETEVTRYGSHTESRMRETCTYGSMRGRAYPITRGAPLYSTPFYRRSTVDDSCVREMREGMNDYGDAAER